MLTATVLLFAVSVALPPDRDDLAFAVAQERFVIDATPAAHPVRGLDPMFGADTGNLIRMLGCEHHFCREVAEKLIAASGMAFARPLVWATRSTDAEVRFRAEGLLRPLTPPDPLCPTCDGSGWSKLGDWACHSCEGSGRLR